MINLIKFELRRLVKTKSFYICQLVIVFFVVIATVAFASEDSSIGEVGEYMLLTSIPNSGMDLILPIFISILICGDFNCGIIKAVIARGYSRSMVYCAKYFTILIVAFSFSIISLLSFLFCQLRYTKLSVEWDNKLIKILLVQILTMVVIATFSFLFSMILKKKSSSIATGILFPTIIALFVSVIDGLIKSTNLKLSEFWITTFLNHLSDLEIKNEILSKIIFCDIVYIVILFVIGCFAFRKSDI